jgi:RNA polymerase sigma-70 factor (ECF subfamily)
MTPIPPVPPVSPGPPVSPVTSTSPVPPAPASPAPPAPPSAADVAPGVASHVTPDVAPDVAPDADALLVQRAVAGDDRAFELLVLKHRRRVERLIGRMVRDADLVEELAQETFIKAWRALPQFRGDAQFYTWLYRIAVNTAKKALVALKRDPVLPEHALQLDTDADETSARQPEPTTTETPETELAARELAAAVNAAMEALPEDLRQAVTLREIEGLSYEEIAAAMDCPIGTVRSRIFRAREAISARIRPLLDRQGGKRW